MNWRSQPLHESECQNDLKVILGVRYGRPKTPRQLASNRGGCPPTRATRLGNGSALRSPPLEQTDQGKRLDIRKKRRQRKKNKRQAALLPARREDVIDVLERVLTKGVVFEIEEDTVAGSEEVGGAGAWFRVSIAGVDVLKIEAGVSWRSLVEPEEEEEEEEEKE